MYERRQAQHNKTMTRRLKHYSLFAVDTHTHKHTHHLSIITLLLRYTK